MAMGMSPGRSRRGRRGGRAPMAEINVTPLVDVMLVLLIIFMVTAPLLKAAVPIELPESRASPLNEERNEVAISLTRGGELYIDEQPVSDAALADRLAAIPADADGKRPLVTLRADKALDYGRVMAVMGELNRAGFNSISLVTTVGSAPPADVRQGSESGQ